MSDYDNPPFGTVTQRKAAEAIKQGDRVVLTPFGYRKWYEEVGVPPEGRALNSVDRGGWVMVGDEVFEMLGRALEITPPLKLTWWQRFKRWLGRHYDSS